MWSMSAGVRTSASAEQVWAAYLDVANWPEWDRGLARYTPDGPFATGTQGVLQPAGGPDLPFALTLVEPGRRFDDRTFLGPDEAIVGRHALKPVSGGTQITHTIEIDAPDAAGLAEAMGFKQEELQETVTALARYVEELAHD